MTALSAGLDKIKEAHDELKAIDPNTSDEEFYLATKSVDAKVVEAGELLSQVPAVTDSQRANMNRKIKALVDDTHLLTERRFSNPDNYASYVDPKDVEKFAPELIRRLRVEEA